MVHLVESGYGGMVDSFHSAASDILKDFFQYFFPCQNVFVSNVPDVFVFVPFDHRHPRRIRSVQNKNGD